MQNQTIRSRIMPWFLALALGLQSLAPLAYATQPATPPESCETKLLSREAWARIFRGLRQILLPDMFWNPIFHPDLDEQALRAKDILEAFPVGQVFSFLERGASETSTLKYAVFLKARDSDAKARVLGDGRTTLSYLILDPSSIQPVQDQAGFLYGYFESFKSPLVSFQLLSGQVLTGWVQEFSETGILLLTRHPVSGVAGEKVPVRYEGMNPGSILDERCPSFWSTLETLRLDAIARPGGGY